METIANIGVALFGGLAIYLVGRLDHRQRWGYVAGLCSQPFWFYIGWTTGQWAIIAMNAWYTFAWGKGFYNHWIVVERRDH